MLVSCYPANVPRDRLGCVRLREPESGVARVHSGGGEGGPYQGIIGVGKRGVGGRVRVQSISKCG